MVDALVSMPVFGADAPALEACEPSSEAYPVAGINLPLYQRLVDAFLTGRPPCTLRAYRGDLEDFRLFVGTVTLAQAVAVLLGGGQGQANLVALAYRTHMLERKLAAASINRRLAALRSLGKVARMLGQVPWGLDVEGVRSEGYRDTRGPGVASVRQALVALGERGDPKALRDQALVRCLFDLGLRRGEVVSLDREHLDLRRGILTIQGKGRSEREQVSLPGPTRQALAAWVAARGEEPGPLFFSLDRVSPRHRLDGTSVYKLVRKLGDQLGVKMRPHGLRHAAITEALERTGGDVRKCQRFSRHRDARTLLRYDDNRRDLAGEVACLIAE